METLKHWWRNQFSIFCKTTKITLKPKLNCLTFFVYYFAFYCQKSKTLPNQQTFHLKYSLRYSYFSTKFKMAVIFLDMTNYSTHRGGQKCHSLYIPLNIEFTEVKENSRWMGLASRRLHVLCYWTINVQKWINFFITIVQWNDFDGQESCYHVAWDKFWLGKSWPFSRFETFIRFTEAAL